ncbi:MAG: winged helix-turn-helix domain-containing protein [Phycisphaerae bacterium]
MARVPVMRVTSPKQWEVALTPIRSEIVQGLRCLGPCSAAELGKMLDRPADTLYRHLEALQRAGYVVETGTRKRGRHVERLFDLTADDFAMGFADASSPVGRQGIVRTGEAFLDAMQRALEGSAMAGELQLPNPEPNFVINYEVSWLKPEDFRKARALMYQIKQLMDGARPTRDGRLYASITVMCPVTRKQRPSSAKEGKKKSSRGRVGRSEMR